MRSLQVILGVLVAYAIYWLWLWVSLMLIRGEEVREISRYSMYSILVVLGILVDFFYASRWQPARLGEKSPGWVAASMALAQTLTIFAIMVTFFFAVKDMVISRFFLGTCLPLMWLGLYAVNLSGSAWLSSHLFRGARLQKALVIGRSDQISRMQSWLKRQRHFGIDVVGVVISGMEVDSDASVFPVLGGFSDLQRILGQVRASVLIHIGLPQGDDSLRGLHNLCDACGTRLAVAYDLGPDLARNASFMVEGGTHLMAFRDEPLEAPLNRILKRSIDLTLAAFVVTLVLPITSLLVWLLQRRQSPGPLFYRQTRTGLHNEQFIIYKYRTMHVGNASPERQATQGDDRIFPAGRWLRSSSIDELPQFINVLLGEMSVVGPRPHLEVHDVEFLETAEKYRVRQWVKPGITGLAQVSGHRGETKTPADVLARTSADVHYLENWSLKMDLQIILRTACQMLRPPKSAC